MSVIFPAALGKHTCINGSLKMTKRPPVSTRRKRGSNNLTLFWAPFLKKIPYFLWGDPIQTLAQNPASAGSLSSTHHNDNNDNDNKTSTATTSITKKNDSNNSNNDNNSNDDNNNNNNIIIIIIILIAYM